jgi:hypothetical protein
VDSKTAENDKENNEERERKDTNLELLRHLTFWQARSRDSQTHYSFGCRPD